jgi:hypothetical protein
MNTWDEKKSIELKTNSENFTGSINETTTNAIKKDCEKTVCENTGRTRNCPKCNSKIFHATKYIRNRMVKLNSTCRNCDSVAKKSKESDRIRSCPKCKKVISYKKKWNRDNAEKVGAMCGNCSRIKNKNLTRKCPKCSVVITYKHGSKLNRANKENRVCNGCRKKLFIKKMADKAKLCGNRSFFPNYNKTACEYFNWLNKFMEWDGQYATYKGEKNILNYFVDYYEPTHNIVIEWDENYHSRKKQKNMDKQRQNEIKKAFGCKFYRYNELTHVIDEV